MQQDEIGEKEHDKCKNLKMDEGHYLSYCLQSVILIVLVFVSIKYAKKAKYLYGCTFHEINECDFLGSHVQLKQFRTEITQFRILQNWKIHVCLILGNFIEIVRNF